MTMMALASPARPGPPPTRSAQTHSTGGLYTVIVVVAVFAQPIDTHTLSREYPPIYIEPHSSTCTAAAATDMAITSTASSAPDPHPHEGPRLNEQRHDDADGNDAGSGQAIILFRPRPSKKAEQTPLRFRSPRRLRFFVEFCFAVLVVFLRTRRLCFSVVGRVHWCACD